LIGLFMYYSISEFPKGVGQEGGQEKLKLKRGRGIRQKEWEKKNLLSNSANAF
jgi:hypothetical protein